VMFLRFSFAAVVCGVNYLGDGCWNVDGLVRFEMKPMMTLGLRGLLCNDCVLLIFAGYLIIVCFWLFVIRKLIVMNFGLFSCVLCRR